MLAIATVLLLLLAWAALSGGVRQLARPLTPGQRVETWAQLALGVLSLLVAATSFPWRRRKGPVRAPRLGPIRAAWAATLVVSAGLSPLVWGPPMPVLAALFAALALLLAAAVIRGLRMVEDGPGSQIRRQAPQWGPCRTTLNGTGETQCPRRRSSAPDSTSPNGSSRTMT